MWLLKHGDNHKITLAGPFDSGSTIPPYAILSHTWGFEEVTFQDLRDGTGVDKRGWLKIEFCVEQARRDGLDYSWVDTCCIDKTNSTELQRSINSMFRWYRAAERCYVYLWVSSARKKSRTVTDRSQPVPMFVTTDGERLCRRADGSLEVGPCRSFSLQSQSSSSQASATDLEVRGTSSKTFRPSPTFRFRPYVETTCRSLVSKSASSG